MCQSATHYNCWRAYQTVELNGVFSKAALLGTSFQKKNSPNVCHTDVNSLLYSIQNQVASFLYKMEDKHLSDSRIISTLEVKKNKKSTSASASPDPQAVGVSGVYLETSTFCPRHVRIFCPQDSWEGLEALRVLVD